MVEGEDEGIPAKKPTQFPPPTQKKKKKKKNFGFWRGRVEIRMLRSAEIILGRRSHTTAHSKTHSKTHSKWNRIHRHTPRHTHTHTLSWLGLLRLFRCWVVWGGAKKKGRLLDDIFVVVVFFSKCAALRRRTFDWHRPTWSTEGGRGRR